MKKYTKQIAYAACAVALVGSFAGWWFPAVSAGLSAASALLSLVVAMNIKED
ncbi:hypothetical protein [Alloscardovia criceti]|uniref:hypothetical protein n=1 Tax=Alloscardovia criceti TaxID=356828 RepID=UPI0012EA4F4F|nr:hypothetical protein [Alloscardovia criceti]